MSLMPFTLDLRLWRWQVPGGDKLPRQLVGDAMPRSRCRCPLQRSPRLSGRNPSSLSVSPSSGQVVTAIGINRNMPLRPADRFRAWVAAQKRRHAGVEGKPANARFWGS
jgi:hypothetical protein